MIKFVFDCESQLPYPFPKEYPEIIKFEGAFSIIINENLYFYEPNFPVFEFLFYVNFWEKNGGDMIYNSIETDENPIISFKSQGGLFYIKSSWEIYELKEGFSKEDLLAQLDLLRKDLVRKTGRDSRNTGDGSPSQDKNS